MIRTDITNETISTQTPNAAMPNWKYVQYSGDKNSIKELYNSYHVEGFLRMCEERRRKQDKSTRNQLVQDGVQLTKTLSPRIHCIIDKIRKILDIDLEFDIFSLEANELNAFASLDITEDGYSPFLTITARALEELNDDEITFIIGHEIGHILFQHNRMLFLYDKDEEKKNRQTVLPYLGEHLFLNWRKHSEISADRIGLMCVGDLVPAARALIKTGFGLSEKNLNLDINNLLQQIESIKDRPEIIDSEFKSHPLLPVRLKALAIFSEVLSADKDSITGLAEADIQIDKIFSWLKRFPRKETSKAVMHILAAAGKRILMENHFRYTKQIEELYLQLHTHFTETPEEVLKRNIEDQEELANTGRSHLNELKDDSYNNFILSRLCDIALAHGTINETEAQIIIDTAEALGESRQNAIATMISATNTVGFKTDIRLTGIVEDLQTGFINKTSDIRKKYFEDQPAS